MPNSRSSAVDTAERFAPIYSSAEVTSFSLATAAKSSPGPKTAAQFSAWSGARIKQPLGATDRTRGQNPVPAKQVMSLGSDFHMVRYSLSPDGKQICILAAAQSRTPS